METHCISFDTKTVHGAGYVKSATGAISTPIYQSATFEHIGTCKSTGYDYSRVSNPTREELERTIALLEGGAEALAFSSGLAAVTNVFTLFKSGDHLIVTEDMYGGTYRLLEEILKKYGITASYVDTTDVSNILKAVNEKTRAIFIETPSNPLMTVTDIKDAVRLAKERGIATIVDNTFLTPYLQNPLSLGADIVVHSGTKFLGGHNDALAGFVVLKDNKYSEQLRIFQKTQGAVLSPFESWLILRGLKTLAIRMEKQQENALKIAQWLKGQKFIEKVLYPGLKDSRGYDIMLKQSRGSGSMISFLVDSEETVRNLLEGVKIIAFAESLGGVESLITYPYFQTHADIPEVVKESKGITKKLLRLSVGIENAEDLINDLKQAMEVR